MKQRLILIGNGMAGARFLEELLIRGGRDLFDVTVFGQEPHGNYNRILLSGVLAGTHDPKDIFINPIEWYSANGIRLLAGVRAVRIDRIAKRVIGEDGSNELYDKLVIATGSRPLVPPIRGISKRGVFLFRTLDDCRRIIEYAGGARRAAVIGGGLLGLEAARGLLNLGLEVHVVHLMQHLMETQLDAIAGAILKGVLEKMGMRIHLEKVTTAILGPGEVTGLAFKDGSALECDMVLICAGIRPNVELASRAGLTIKRGIVVGDDLASPDDPDIYAIGECAEHRGQLYGLVPPLWEQAKVLAERLTGHEAEYRGSKISTKLKVMGVDLVVMGEKEPSRPDAQVLTYWDPSRGIYKKLILQDSRIAGAILLGDGLAAPILLQAFDREAPISGDPSELLFPATQPSRPAALSAPAIVCNCNGVSRERIIAAAKAGHRTVEAIGLATRAGTGCGSCRAEIQALLERTIGKAEVAEILNKIEEYKREKDGLDVMGDVPRYAEQGWEAITESDRERLKWVGVFFRRQTPGYFMMRVRIPNGMTNSNQLRTIAEISREFGRGFADITTRQQIQLRWFRIEHVPQIWERLSAVGLNSLQTGMDNIRNVIGCPAAGLTPQELLDASPIVRQLTSMILGNKAYTNLPRKFNVAITGCLENCIHAESQDIALVPATKEIRGEIIKGFNVAVGGKMGSGGYRIASPLDLFVRPEEAAEICSHIALIFRDFGPRQARNRARLAFLIEEWGAQKFRQMLEARAGRPLEAAGADARQNKKTDHIGCFRQKQRGLNYIGLVVPVGRIRSQQLFEVARLADTYGNGEIRLTTNQNLIIPNVPDRKIEGLLGEPLLEQLKYDPSEIMRGLVSCTGIDYCHMAQIETKELAIKTAEILQQRLAEVKPISIHWSGCPAGCGNHSVADIGLLGKKVRFEGEVIDAVDIFVGGRAGPNPKTPLKLLEDVPCERLPEVLAQIIPYLNRR
jgi:NAD(P)H-nitrite reductase large subunit